MDGEQLTQEIKSYMDKHGGDYDQWYCGISEDPKERLFDGHDVDESRDHWIHGPADDSKTARRVERYLTDTLGCDGGPGGGDEDADNVYAYEKSSHTEP